MYVQQLKSFALNLEDNLFTHTHTQSFASPGILLKAWMSFQSKRYVIICIHDAYTSHHIFYFDNKDLIFHAPYSYKSVGGTHMIQIPTFRS